MPYRLRFSHALLHQACYEQLSRVERLSWHQRSVYVSVAGQAGGQREVPIEVVRWRGDEDNGRPMEAVARLRGAVRQSKLRRHDEA